MRWKQEHTARQKQEHSAKLNLFPKRAANLSGVISSKPQLNELIDPPLGATAVLMKLGVLVLFVILEEVLRDVDFVLLFLLNLHILLLLR